MPKRYIEIRKSINEKIRSGEWPIGYRLPREVDLCREFDASRTTVRRALSGLADEGKLRRVKGTGTFVSRPQVFDKTTLFVQSFAEELQARGLTCVTEVLEFRTLPMTEEHVTSNLGISRGDQVLKLSRFRYSSELKEQGPITLTTSYFPDDIGRVIQRYDFESNSLYRVMKINGIIRVRSEKNISATHLPPKFCRLLHAAEDDLFFLITSKSWDKSGRLVEFCESYYPIDRNVFTINVLIEE